MELHEKAWVFNKQKFDDPYFTPDDVFYGTKLSQAKGKAWKSIGYEEYKDFLGREFTFLTLPLVRAKEYDTYLVNGEVKTLLRIEEDNRYKERNEYLQSLVDANPNAKAYIRKGGYYYRPNSCGYTERIIDAGVYTIQDAVREVRGCDLRDNMDAVVIDTEKHNAAILEKIEELKRKLI